MCTNPLIIVYDKGGTVEVYGECFKLIGPFCLFLHVSIIFLNLQPPNVNTKIGVGSLAWEPFFLVYICIPDFQLYTPESVPLASLVRQ